MRSRRTVVVLAGSLLLLAGAYIYHHQRHVPRDEIRVGAIFDLTGSLSYMGQWSLEGAKLAEDDVNANGGIKGKRLRLVIDDAETNPQRATTEFERMISDDSIKVVLGFNSSSEVMAAAPIANEQHVILFSTGAASPNITGAGEFIFRNRLSGAKEASTMADIAFRNLHLRRGIILYINNDYGQGYADAFRSRFAGLGGTVMLQTGFAQDSTDFKSLIQSLRAYPECEFVYLATYSREGGAILRQSHEAAFNTKWLASNAIESDDLFGIARGAEEGLLYTVAEYDPRAPYARSFNNAYRQRYGRDSEMFAAHAYDGVRITAKLIAESGNRGESLRDALHNLRDYPGVSGQTTFDKNGDVIKRVALKMVHDHHFIQVDPDSLQDSEIKVTRHE